MVLLLDYHGLERPRLILHRLFRGHFQWILKNLKVLPEGFFGKVSTLLGCWMSIMQPTYVTVGG